MNYSFTSEDIDAISEVLSTEPTKNENSCHWLLENFDGVPSVSLTLYSNVGKDKSFMVSVQAISGFFELFNVHGWNKFSSQEIIFWSKNNDLLSAIIITAAPGVSFYSNVPLSTLNAQLNTLDEPLLISYMQLSVYSEIIK